MSVAALVLWSRELMICTKRRMFVEASVMMIVLLAWFAVTSAVALISGARSWRSLTASTLRIGITQVFTSSVSGISSGLFPKWTGFSFFAFSTVMILSCRPIGMAV